MDLATALSATFKDPAWARKCAIVGLLGLIPFVGNLVQIGWIERWYHARLAGSVTLPEPTDEFVPDIGRGVRFVLALGVSFLPPALLLGGLATVVLFATGVFEQSTSDDARLLAIGAVVLVSFVATLPLVLLLPGFLHQHFVRGRTWLWGGLGEVLARASGAPTALLLVLVGLFAANLVAQLGVVLCFVGVFFTIQVGQAMQFAVYAEWARATDRFAPPSDV